MKRGLIADEVLAILISSMTAASTYGARHGFIGGVWVGPDGAPGGVLFLMIFHVLILMPIHTAMTERQLLLNVIHLQRKTRTPLPKAQFYWYYCKNPSGYYPYVKQCPSGWMKVVHDNVSPQLRRLMRHEE